MVRNEWLTIARVHKGMLYDHAVFDTSLASEIEKDPALVGQLQHAFLDSLHRAAGLGTSPADAERWAGAALRLQCLAGSVGMPGVDAAVRETLQGGAAGWRADLAD